MRAVTYHGTRDFRVDNVPDPTLKEPTDAVLRVTSTAICGSDLHIYDGFMPQMKTGDVIGHEFMGEIVETGPETGDLKVGDRVIIPFNITCGHCPYCRSELFALCDNTNPDGDKLEKMYGGHAPAGLFGYSHLFGGYDGGQAEYVRIPNAGSVHLKVPAHISDEKVLFLTDIFPTGWQAAVNAGIEEGSTVAVWGCGPVGLFAIKSALLLGASRVFAIDRVPERLALAAEHGAETIDEGKEDVYDVLMERTGGRLPECAIDAVGLEAHGTNLIEAAFDRAKTAVFAESDRPSALRQAIMCTAKGGTLSIAGVYAGIVDKFPIGAAFGKGLTFKMGQTHVLKYAPELLRRIEAGEIDPSFMITHRGTLEDAPALYDDFAKKKDGCIKVVLTP